MKITETIYTTVETEMDAEINVKLTTESFEGQVGFANGEPEDMNLDRDLSDAYAIQKLLKEAYDAGIRGESFEYEHITEEY